MDKGIWIKPLRAETKNPSEKNRRDHYNGWVSKYREPNSHHNIKTNFH